MYFKSVAHKERFLAVLQQSGKALYDGGKIDQEYGTALYVLTSSSGMWEKAHGYVNRSSIDIPTMLEEVHLSGGYTVLVQLAGNLFNSQVHVDPIELMRLDEQNFMVALQAIQIRRGGYHIEEIRADNE